MKKLLLMIVAMAAMTVHAQDAAQDSVQAQQPTATLKFGYVSYERALKSMPEYAKADSVILQLRSQYQAEMTSAENDFNKKYEEFLDGQASFPKTILQKRQNELQEMLNRNIAFKKESLQLLAKAEAEVMEPLKARLANALATVGQARQLAFILNTDINAVPWLNVSMGEDVSEAVIEALK